MMSQKPLLGSPPTITKRLVKTALHQAILDGRVHQVRLLVEKHGVNVDCKDVYGRTPTMLTSMIDEETGVKMARIMISDGADLTLRDNMGRTALSLACMNGREKIVDEILRKDILNINEPDNDGNTPLHHAASGGNPNIVKLLGDLFLKFGLDVDTRNKLGYTALLLACKHAHYVSAHHLLTIGNASPALRDGESYLNANEWTNKSLQDVILTSKRFMAPPSAPAFTRESSMYQRTLTPICKHSRPQTVLTSVRRNDTEISKNETLLDGKDARQLVLYDISLAESQAWNTKKITTHKIVHPSTAKLLAISRRQIKSAAPPDMTSIFKMYSDQYQPDWRKERKILTLHASKSNKIPMIIRTSSKYGIKFGTTV